MAAVIRARAADLASCAALYMRVGAAHFTWKPADAFKAADFAAIAAQEEIWVIHENDRVAAFLSYYVPGHFVHLLFVEQASRGRGLGRALQRHARCHYGAPHTLKVGVQNQPARAFYGKLGYTEVEAGDSDGIAWLRLRSA